MKSFHEWLGSESGIFSPTSEIRSSVVYSKERDKFFWIVFARNWEQINRKPNWYAITLQDSDEATNLLNGTTRIDFSITNKDIMAKVKKAKPDILNSDPDTKSYSSFDSALLDLDNI